MKPESDRGYYLHPDAFNQPEKRGVEWARNPEMMRQMKETHEKQIEDLKRKAQAMIVDRCSSQATFTRSIKAKHSTSGRRAAIRNSWIHYATATEGIRTKKVANQTRAPDSMFNMKRKNLNALRALARLAL